MDVEIALKRPADPDEVLIPYERTRKELGLDGRLRSRSPAARRELEALDTTVRRRIDRKITLLAADPSNLRYVFMSGFAPGTTSTNIELLWTYSVPNAAEPGVWYTFTCSRKGSRGRRTNREGAR